MAKTFRKIYQRAAPGIITARGVRRYQKKFRAKPPEEEEEDVRSQAALQKITEPTSRQAGAGKVEFMTERYV